MKNAKFSNFQVIFEKWRLKFICKRYARTKNKKNTIQSEKNTEFNANNKVYDKEIYQFSSDMVSDSTTGCKEPNSLIDPRFVIVITQKRNAATNEVENIEKVQLRRRLVLMLSSLLALVMAGHEKRMAFLV